jgi:hypothetical protein
MTCPLARKLRCLSFELSTRPSLRWPFGRHGDSKLSIQWETDSMLKKLLLAGAVVLAGSAMVAQTAEAQGRYGPYRSFGPSYRSVGPSYRSVGPVYRSGRPVIVAPAPVYRSQRVYSAYPQYNYGYGFAPPVYQSYRPSFGRGMGNFGYPVYGPTFGTPFGTPSGLSLYIGR